MALAPLAAQAQIIFDNFDDGDVSDIGFFSGGADGIGIGVGPTTGVGGADATGLSVGINPGVGGGFAGIVIPGPAGTTDISAANYISFYFRPTTVQAGNQPLTLEIALQEDVDGNGTYEGASEDEYKAVFDVPLGTDYTLVEIPLYAFGDSNTNNPGANDGFDFTKLLQIIGVYGGIQGPEFAFAIDEVGFATGMVVANEPGASDLPDGSVLSAAYPNPFNVQTRFDLTLERSQVVRVEVYDVLGRRVALLHEGSLAAQTPYTFHIDGRDWPSGTYVYRVTGETFAETASIVLVK